MRAAQDGDGQAFETLHDRYARLVYAVLLGRLGPDEASDAAQDVFFRAWRQMDQLRDPDAFSAWLCTIARNVARMRVRAAPVHVPLPAELASTEPSVHASLDAEFILDQLRTLPEKLREPLTLRLVDAMSGVEIAELTGLTHGTVRVYLHEGMRMLRARLQSHGIDQ